MILRMIVSLFYWAKIESNISCVYVESGIMCLTCVELMTTLGPIGFEKRNIALLLFTSDL